jgi:putative selenium metabolism protein SsnA
MTIALVGATVVTAIDPVDVVEASVVIDGGRVADVRAGPPPSGVTTIDCSGCLIIPGNVCAHTHAYSSLARGMPYHLEPPRDFVEILRRVWWRLDRALDEATIRASARVAAMEALLAGTTTVVDHHASPGAIDGSLDIVADAFGELGVRSVLAYETTDRDGMGQARAGLAENRRFLARVEATAPALVRGLVGAHASFTVSDATLEACIDLARSTDCGLHIHVAEDAADELDAEAAYGTRVLHRLERAGGLVPAPVLAHGVHLDHAEAALFRASDATLVHNPRSNMNNAVGHAPLDILGSRVALGTDGIGADMFEESREGYLRFAEERHAAERPGPHAGPDPSWTLERLAQGAALAAGMFVEPLLGRLVAGAPADIVVLDYPAPTPVDGSTLAAHWVFGLSARSVRDVLVDGRIVVRDRRLATVDQDALVADARAEAVRLWRRLEEIPIHPYVPGEVMVG